MVTLSQLTTTLAATQQTYIHLPLSNAMSVIITQRGARILGPFLSDGTPLCWINPALADAEHFQAFMEAGDWNMGGERVWIAPEIQFNVPDRGRFWQTHRIVPQMDPGNYHLTSDLRRVTLESQMSLNAYNLATGKLNIDVRHVITSLVPDPLRSTRHSVLVDDVAYGGLSRIVSLNITETSDIQCESWCLIQLNPGGILHIPVTGEEVQATTYFGDPAPEALIANHGALHIHLTGQQQYKLGYKAVHLTGRMGYLNRLSDRYGFLLIRNFFNDPSSVYCEEPDNQPGVNGHSVHVYNDGGQYGANGEMECNGRTIGGTTGRSQTHDDFILWAYVGEVERLKQIGHILLGVNM
jgi:hypothetical protein